MTLVEDRMTSFASSRRCCKSQDCDHQQTAAYSLARIVTTWYTNARSTLVKIYIGGLHLDHMESQALMPMAGPSDLVV